MVPPLDSDKAHRCEWRDFATHLKSQVAILEAQVEVLTRAFAKRSEKIGKMPRIARPPRTPAETADRRLEQALLRAERVVTEEKLEPVPEALKKCPVCNGTSFRSVGSTKGKRPGWLARAVVCRRNAWKP